MLERLLLPEIKEMIQGARLHELQEALEPWPPAEIAKLINELDAEEELVVFRLLPRDLAAETFEYISAEKQQEILESLTQDTSRLTHLLNDLSPDDRTALLEELPGTVAQRLISMLSPEERRITTTLLGYPEESIGRLMTPDYVALYKEWTVQQSLEYIRKHGKDSETLNMIYVVDEHGNLIDDFRVRRLLLAEPDTPITELMDDQYNSLKAYDDQELAIKVFRDYDRVALPVTDSRGMLIGIVTIDDVLDVAEEEATEDIQKIGGSDVLEKPYLNASFGNLVGSRSKWLIVLFLGQLLTATAMSHYESFIALVPVLTIFIPLIISSGGNSGSQAATLIIRSLSIGEVKLRDWWQVIRREVFSGLALGSILGILGFLRVAAWEWFFGAYGANWLIISLVVGTSLVGVVMWGTISGSMLPFVLQRLGADPAASSAPFVATMVDVVGLVIYFTVAAIFMSGLAL
ncbi:MAG: magnesium transporter [Candidatus Marinimicrobia bacterium]|nr:magnesium transporter [Candidatus Neomarinimicrobiota bacterium]